MLSSAFAVAGPKSPRGVSPGSFEETEPAFSTAPKFPALVKPQSANVRSCELSKDRLRPQSFCFSTGVPELGSTVYQVKPAWLPLGEFSLITHEPAGRSEAFCLPFSTAPDLSRMPPVSVAAAASGDTVLKDVTLSPLSARVMAERAATPLREARRWGELLLCAFISIDLSNAKLCLAPRGKALVLGLAKRSPHKYPREQTGNRQVIVQNNTYQRGEKQGKIPTHQPFIDDSSQHFKS